MLARPGEARQKPTPTQRRRKVANNEDPNDTVRRLQRLPPNKACADCSSKLTQCVNLSHGTFVCMACSGVHREFSHKIKGIGHSSFTAEEVAKLQHSNSGNEAVNAKYLARYDARTARIKAPHNNNDLQHLRSWIKMKYIDKSWCERDPTAQNNNAATKANVPPKSSSRRKPKSAPAPAPAAPTATPAADPFGFDSISSSANNSSWDAFGSSPAPPPAASFQADFGNMNGASPAPSAAPPAAPTPAFQADFGGMNGTMLAPPQQQPPAPAAPSFQANFGNNFSQPTMVSMPSPPPQGQSQQMQSIPQQQQQGQPMMGNQQQQQSFQANFNQGMMQPSPQQQQQQQPPPPQQQMQPTPYQANFAQGQMMQQSQVQQQQPISSVPATNFQANFNQVPQNNLMTATPPQQQQQQPQQQPSFQANFAPSPAPMPPQQQQPSSQANFAQSPAPMPSQQQQQQQQQPSFQANFAPSPAQMPPQQQQQQQQQQPSVQINAGTNPPQVGGEVTKNEQSSGMNFGQFPDQSHQVMNNGQQGEMGITNQTPPTPVQNASMNDQPNAGMSVLEVPANQSQQQQQDDAPSGGVNPNAFKQADDKKDAFSAFDGLSLEPTNSLGGAMTPAQEVSTHASEKANLQFSRFKEGQQVIYTNSQGSAVALIKKVHFDDDLEPFYTIDLNGREKQTDDAHLSLPGDSPENKSRNESSPSAKLQETEAMLKNLSESQLSEVQKFISSLLSSASLATPSMGMAQQQQAGNVVTDPSKQQMNGATHQQGSVANAHSMPLPQMTSFQQPNSMQATTSNMTGVPTQMNTSQPMMQMQQYPSPQMYAQQPPMQQQQTAQPMYTQQQATQVTGMANGSMPQMSMQQPQNNTGSVQNQLQSPNPSMAQPMAPQQYAPSPVMAPTAPPPNCLPPVEKEGNPFDMY